MYSIWAAENNLEETMDGIRYLLVKTALQWEEKFFVMSHIASDISKYDAAKFLGCDEKNTKG